MRGHGVSLKTASLKLLCIRCFPKDMSAAWRVFFTDRMLMPIHFINGFWNGEVNMSAWKIKLSIPITIVCHNFGLAFKHFKGRELIKNHTLQHTWFIHTSGERIFLQAVLCTCQQWDITDAAVRVLRTLHRAEKSVCSIFGMLSCVCQIGMWKLSQITQTSQAVLTLLIYYELDNPHPHSPITPFPAVHGWGCGRGGPALASTSIYFKGRAENILFFSLL